MRLYDRYVLPRVLHLAMKQDLLTPFRSRVIAQAQGDVLEVGVGSGLNLPLYSSAVRHVVGLDTSDELLAMAVDRKREAKTSVELIKGSAETLPFEDRTLDTIVTTWTLCSIPDVTRALSEMRRVLRPGGQLLFVEHGRSPDSRVSRWQDRLTPLWMRIAGGCHLNRPVRSLLEASGFHVDRIDSGYITGPRPMTFMSEGVARGI